MRIKSQKTSVASYIALLFSTSTLLGAASANSLTEQDDTWQEAQIWTTYQISPYLRNSHIEVKVEDGDVTLNGSVSQDTNRELAEAIASGIAGIKSVDNQIEVVENDKPNNASIERNYAQMVDDASITSAINSKILWSKLSDTTETNIDTYQSKVTLTGLVSSQEDSDTINAMSQHTKGVISVANQLVISDEPISISKKKDPGTEEFEEKKGHSMLADGWITTKIKSTYMYSSNVDSGQITVNTTDGIVVLEGTIKDGAERALAIALARNIRGVKSVTSDKLVLL
ncbi:BON domain-containing protein [Paraglaciecola chathamensis]|uniref:BON domain-containing protein n=1 Tax=Paraglaciecola chathamensis TaxID=368405 RepID=A0ABS0WG26_9ALTE|nr:BON domain-containing protein [Paraglaciecola chathamensis]MBJ2137440.1 BON domain-containing protein [Paraglaciecola chathamensis]